MGLGISAPKIPDVGDWNTEGIILMAVLTILLGVGSIVAGIVIGIVVENSKKKKFLPKPTKSSSEKKLKNGAENPKNLDESKANLNSAR